MADAFDDFRDGISNPFVMWRMHAACLTLGRQPFVCMFTQRLMTDLNSKQSHGGNQGAQRN